MGKNNELCKFVIIYLILFATGIIGGKWIATKTGLSSDSLLVIILTSLATLYISIFIEKVNHLRSSIGALRLIGAEIQVNQHILEDMLNTMIPAFEQQYQRHGNLPQLPQAVWDDAAEFMRIPCDQLLNNAFNANYVGVGNLDNVDLMEKILNQYTVNYHYYLQTSFKMQQLNWALLDAIKVRLKKEIINSMDLVNDIVSEVKKLKSINPIAETFYLLKKYLTHH